MATNRYCIDVAKRGTAGCKECKQKIEKGMPRIAKIIPSPFSEGDMKQWFHIRCIFQKLTRARASTKKIDSPDDLEGWEEIDDECKEEVQKCMSEFSVSGVKTPQKQAKKRKANPGSPSRSPEEGKPSPKRGSHSPGRKSPDPSSSSSKPSKDDLFREFRRLCAEIANESSYNGKTEIVASFFGKGSDKKSFKGDLYLWVKMLLPNVDKTVYNLQNKQIIKLFSQIFNASQEEMLEDLEEGDVAETISVFFESSKQCAPSKKSTITLQEVDGFLKELSKFSKEEEQTNILKKVAKRCTANDLKMFIRLIKHDLRINAGPKHILEALHPTAYQAFQASRNLKEIVKRTTAQNQEGTSGKQLHVKASLMTPVLPMLAQVCGSADAAFKKCPNGMFVEIKYDGERVQVHKSGDSFNFFSRSLKPVMPHKILHLKDYIPEAFPYGNDLILDSEILLMNKEGKPLPFGSLGAHKKMQFTDANVCLFVFDCLQFNDENLMNKPLDYRRDILHQNMKPIKNHIMFSEMKHVKDMSELKQLMKSVTKQGLEGLVIKDKKSIYEPGKRHWLKMKKDYLKDGGMADSADLVVLGAWYGTGKNGGKMSIFLMGCLNGRTKKWCTVTKVHGGHDDRTLTRLQKELHMIKISGDSSRVPSWLNVERSLVPDFVAEDPEKSQVWEVIGAEFSKAEAHTADGISIRFPRVTRIRKDKTPKEATTLAELKVLYEASKETVDMIGLTTLPEGSKKSDGDDSDSPSRKGSPSRSRSGSPVRKEPKRSTPKKRRESTSQSRSRSRSPARKEPKRSTPKKRRESTSQSRSRSRSPARKATSTPRKDSRSRSQNRSPAKKLKRDTTSQDGKTDSSHSPSSAMPNVFTGVKLCLPSSLEDVDTLKRYFIAFDGTLLKDHEASNASHVVTVSSVVDEVSPPTAIQVTPGWLWDSIKMKELMPDRLYHPSAS